MKRIRRLLFVFCLFICLLLTAVIFPGGRRPDFNFLLQKPRMSERVSRNGKLFCFLRKQGEIICFSGAMTSGNVFNSDLFV